LRSVANWRSAGPRERRRDPPKTPDCGILRGDFTAVEKPLIRGLSLCVQKEKWLGR